MNGHTSQSIDGLNYSDYINSFNMYMDGIEGPFKDFNLAYLNYALVHNNTQAIISSAAGRAGKKYNAKKHMPISAMFPTLNEYMIGKVNIKKATSTGEKLAIMLAQNAPKHILDKLKRNSDARRNI